MKEKKIWFIIGLIIVVILILSIFTVKNTKVTNDEKRFKKEYERFNGRTGLSTGKKYKKVLRMSSSSRRATAARQAACASRIRSRLSATACRAP